MSSVASHFSEKFHRIPSYSLKPGSLGFNKRTRGGGVKYALASDSYANVLDPKTKTARKLKILRVLSNPASRDLERRGVITRGAIIETEAGRARVTSRPGQDGVINAVLIE
ncbi:MAG: 30S ribosomal protein S8e [Candidatus Wolframiiraptor sp. EX4484-121]|nr:MAG: 30S ribosomal protein S8e [Candidatus Wolframiiraptor sp. EX4484-121]